MGNDSIPKSPSDSPSSKKGAGIVVNGRKNYFITIGIDQYQHPAIASLGDCCKNDCLQLSALLQQDYSFEPVEGRYDDTGVRIDNSHQVLFNEEATLNNIKQLFEYLSYHPDFSANDDRSLKHNLVIFYSGHGTLAKNSGRNWFHWVPHDYQGDLNTPNNNRLFSLQHDLLKYIGNIRYQHLVLVSDSCHSGGSIELTDYFNSTSQVSNPDPAEERSCWVLCSSASNQKSYTSLNLSYFTAHLIQALSDHKQASYSAESLFIDLNDTLKQSNQRTFHKRLGIIDHNTGQFYFTQNENKVNKIKLSAIQGCLEKSITNRLNFSKEKEFLTDLIPNTHRVIVISSQPDSGLKLLMKSLKKDPLFPGYKIEFHHADDLQLNTQLANTPFEILLVFFNSKLNLHCQDEATLVSALLNKLNGGNLLLSLSLQRKTIHNSELVSAVIRLVATINSSSNTHHHLYFFILDENNTDYSALAPVQYDRFETSILTNDIAVQFKDIKEWYKFQVQMLDAYADEKVYIENYISNNIYSAFSNNFVADRPARVVRKICELAKCPGLADTLLNSIEKYTP